MPPYTNMHTRSLQQLQQPRREVQDSTRDRILKAGEAIFLEKGFQKATIRDICSAAKANVAAVNYHFQDKDGLYIAVVAGLLDRGALRYPLDRGLQEDPSPEDRLRIMIYNILCRLFCNDQGDYNEVHGRFVLEALFGDSPHIGVLVDSFIRPSQAYLRTIIEAVLEGCSKAAADDEAVLSRCAMSLFAQAVYYVYAHNFEKHLDDGRCRDLQDLERLADHITTFSVAGIRAVGLTAHGSNAAV
ncbi:TetR/AcrR family transcriptional regulator [Megalodesulfovibrio gigas]|nr:CerR family C-terminal domain-containing protein [Megalodesulfovibrio gigas]